MNCRDALEHLYAYLDRELNEETVRKIRAHLEICDHCLDRYEFEERLQKLISDRGRVDVDPEPLKERVLQRIREIDDQNRPSFFSRFRPFLAAVAAIIVVVVGVYTIMDHGESSLHAADIEPLVDSHLKCIAELVSGTQPEMSIDQISSLVSPVSAQPESFLKPSSDRRLAHASIEKFAGDNTVHYIFRHSGSEISVYVLGPRELKPPPGLKNVHRGNHDYLYGSLDGHNVMLWQCKGIWCVAVSDLDVESMMSFASIY